MKTPVLVLLLVMFAPGTAGAQASELDAAELLADPERWGGDRVAVIGELVGDYSRRDGEVWVQLNDDSYVSSPILAGGEPMGANVGLGARIPQALFSDTVRGGPGRYGQRGPIVRLEGIFVHSDPELGGESYLAVDAARLIDESEPLPTPGPDLWTAVGVGLLGAAGVINYLARRRPGAPKT